MFVKELCKTRNHVRMYKLFSKKDKQWVGNVMINIKHVPKISLLQNTITFHLPHPQIITYQNPLDAETEYHAIHDILHSQ